ncbi:hypothetical protein Ciccas_007318 [Cichlidogyrus casuarinus]|uniref:RRM domain-containing protein n=1 Tax=Cichlidogyrus casuarinus TaxID=1844966 RepID=A0ABD2Q383_9PLAT
MSGDTAEQQAANEKNLENLTINDVNEDNVPPSEPSINGTADNATNNDESDDDSRKLFVGGLSYETDSSNILIFPVHLLDDLRDYFSKWGKVTQSIIKFDRVTGYSRGFGFVTLESEECVDKVLQVPEHKLHNRKIDPKRAKPSREPMKKIFVGGIDPDLTEEQIREYFSQFGLIDSLDLPYDSQKGKRKNYIFVCFTTGAAAKKAIAKERQDICGKQCDVRLAVTREQASRQKAMKHYAANFLDQTSFINYPYADLLSAYASIEPYQYPYYGYDLYGNPTAAHHAAAPQASFGGIYSDYSGTAASLYRGAVQAAGTSPMKPLSVAGAAHPHQFSAAPPNAHHTAANPAGLHPQVFGLAHRGNQPNPQASAARMTNQPAVVHYAAATAPHHTNGPSGAQNPGQSGQAPVMDHDFSGMWQSQAGAQAPVAYTRT